MFLQMFAVRQDFFNIDTFYTREKKIRLMKNISYSTAKLNFFQNSRGRGVEPQLYSLMLICSNSLVLMIFMFENPQR